MKTFLMALLGGLCGCASAWAQGPALWHQSAGPATRAQPLDRLLVAASPGQTVVVTDGAGREYFRGVASPTVAFTVSGALGQHTVSALGQNGQSIPLLTFEAWAKTQIDDGGAYGQMFRLFYDGMANYDPADGRSLTWNGKPYRYFVPWTLDHNHNMRGMKYFAGYGHEFADLMRGAQRSDGMIYSFVQYMVNADYFATRDKFSGYTQKLGDRYFVRQPTENHPEYNYVNIIHQAWKSSGDDGWMRQMLPSAAKALDYAPNDPARWSQRFQLLKRVYTIDSWDFAVEDEYLPNLGLTNSMIIDPQKSKFGVFFGDNTGYLAACDELVEMLEHAGQPAEAQQYRERGRALKERLDKLAWNGRFYTHFIDEDPAVKRNLGVDERSQLAQSNAYSLNRPLGADQGRAIVQTYQQLKNNLPPGSPGEWYAIYPPFGRGFDSHGAKWQYMNGGVGGHVAGELARGAYELGEEAYATDVLNRLFELGKQYDHKIYFAYTGALTPPPPAPKFRPLDLRAQANMDFWVREGATHRQWMNGQRPGDDLRDLPTGEQTLAGIRFRVLDPAQNQRRAVVAVAKSPGLPTSVDIPVNDTARCVYLLHTSAKPQSENVVGGVSFVYADGSQRYHYLLMDKHLTYWWFSQLKTDRSGIAWYGKNQVSEGVGLSWCALDNPEAGKKISKIVLHAPETGGLYTVFGISLADQPHHIPTKMPSFGGPDNWAAATAMAALVEGLAGVKDSPKTAAYQAPRLAPRWASTGAPAVRATVHYPASGGYVSYAYRHLTAQKRLELTVAASGPQAQCHVLLPSAAQAPTAVLVNGQPQAFTVAKVGGSTYADFALAGLAAKEVVVEYQ